MYISISIISFFSLLNFRDCVTPTDPSLKKKFFEKYALPRIDLMRLVPKNKLKSDMKKSQYYFYEYLSGPPLLAKNHCTRILLPHALRPLGSRVKNSYYSEIITGLLSQKFC